MKKLIVIIHAVVSVASAVTTVGPPRPLITSHSPAYPVFSPDGAGIAVALKTGADYDIYLVDLANGETEPLITGPGDQLYPDYYSGDAKLVYCSDETGSFELYVYDVTNGKSSALTVNTPYDVRYPDMSPVFWSDGGEWDDTTDEYVARLYRNIIYEADYGEYSEVFMVRDYGSKPVQLTLSVNTPAEIIPEGTYSTSDYIDIDNFATLALKSFSYPRWDGGGFGFTAVARSAGETESYYIDCNYFFDLKEILPPHSNRFCTPTGNFTQYLLMNPEGRVAIFDIQSGDSFDIGSGDPAYPPTISPDGKAVAYIKNGALVIQTLDNPLSEVANLWKFSEDFAGNQLDKLAENEFIVTSKSYPNIVDAYTQHRPGANVEGPFFITTDSVLYLLYLYYDYLLRSVEVGELIPLVTNLCTTAVTESIAAYETAPAEVKPYLEYARDYWLVAYGLINPAMKLAAMIPDPVRNEWDNIKAGSGTSKLAPDIDYTQFEVRGHYTASNELSNYFRTVMWLSQTTLPMNKSPENDDFVLKALVQSRLMTGEMQADMDAFYDSIGLFIGAPESVDYRQLDGIVNRVYGPDPSYEELCEKGKLPDVYTAINELPPPKIQPQRGYTFAVLPQVFTPDAYILQKLVYPEVGTDINPRGLPKGLDLFAVLGEDRAYEILTNVYNTDEYTNYDKAFSAISEEMRDSDPGFWEKSLTYRWVDLLESLTGSRGTDYPGFMRNIAWRDKSLMTALASWATLRHANILYAKGTGASGSGGGPPEWPIAPKPKGYVEPNDEFYAKMADIVKESKAQLTARGLWPELAEYQDWETDETYGYEDKMVQMLERLDKISAKELAGKPLTEDDYSFIDNYGSPLFELASVYQVATGTYFPEESYGDVSVGGNISNYEGALVADVAFFHDPSTNNTYYLHEALGRALDIYCIHPVESRLHISRGGVLSYYEFTEEGRRLNDDDWKGRLVGMAAGEDWGLFSGIDDWEKRDRLKQEYQAKLERDFAETDAPTMPVWTESFFAPSVFTVEASALRIWDRPFNQYSPEDAKVLGTIREGDVVRWLGQEEWGCSKNQPDDNFRWLLVELEDGRRVWCAQFGYIGDPISTREVYLK